MNVHPNAVFNTVSYNNRKYIPFILESFSLYPEMVHLQIENIKQDIQYATSDYLTSTPIPDKNLLNNSYYTIKYINTFL